jgi:hypothetical protein
MKIQIAYKEAAAVNSVWRWYKDTESALNESKIDILGKIKRGKRLPPEFEFKSPKEVNNQFDQNFKELKYATMFNLISAIEAAFRIDHQIRLDGTRGDDISREFVRLSQRKQKKKGEWTKFGEDILKTWRNMVSDVECKASINTLNGMLQFRDWLAHGRCWERRSKYKYDPLTILMVADSLTHTLPHNNFYGRKYLST